MKVYFPPKPSLISISQNLFSQLELDEDVVAELKYNGDRLILKRFPDRYEFWNRSGSQMKRYKPTKQLLDLLDLVPWKGNCVLDGELLHFKTKNVKNQIVVFDVYEWEGFPTTGFRFQKRRELLEEKFSVFSVGIDQTPHVLLAPQWRGGVEGRFKAVYDHVIGREEIEGLVLKSLSEKVELGHCESPIVHYMFKVRKPGPTYRF